MLVNEVMTTPVITVSPDATLKEAAALLTEHQITAMPVVDGRGELLGVISEADLLLETFLPDQRAHEIPVQVRTGPALTRVGEVMTRQVLVTGPQRDLAEVADLMLSSVVKSLPVIEDDRVVGILSRKDLVRLLAQRDDRIEAEVDDLIRSSGYDWTAEVSDGVVSVEGPVEEAEIEVAQVLVATVPGVVGVQVPAPRAARRPHD